MSQSTHPKSKNGAGLLSPHIPAQYEREMDVVDEAELTEVWAKRAYVLAEPPPASIEGETFDILVLMMGSERYGIPVANVVKIYALEQLTAVPRTPSFVVGVFSTRGRLISVIDLRTFFGLTPSEMTPKSKIIVVSDPQTNMEVGILSDAVNDVITLFQDELEPALTADIGNRARFTQGIAPGMIVVLNATALLNDKELIVQEEIT